MAKKAKKELFSMKKEKRTVKDMAMGHKKHKLSEGKSK